MREFYPDLDLAGLGSDVEDPAGGGGATPWTDDEGNVTVDPLAAGSSASVTKASEAQPFEVVSQDEEPSTDDDIQEEVTKNINSISDGARSKYNLYFSPTPSSTSPVQSLVGTRRLSRRDPSDAQLLARLWKR